MTRKKKIRSVQQASYADRVRVMRQQDILGRAIRDISGITTSDLQEIRQLLRTNPEYQELIHSNPELENALAVQPAPEPSSDFVPVATGAAPPTPPGFPADDPLHEVHQETEETFLRDLTQSSSRLIQEDEVYPGQGRVVATSGGSISGFGRGMPRQTVTTTHPVSSGEVGEELWPEPGTTRTTRNGFPTKKRSQYAEYETFNIDMVTMNDLESLGRAWKAESKDFDQQRDSIQLYRLKEKTMVVLVVIDSKDQHNQCRAIPCSSGIALGGYAHDVGRDSYLVRCVDAVGLGSIPFSLIQTVPSVGNWKVKVPICEAVLVRSFNQAQIRRVEEYRLRYPSDRYRIEFMQMVGCSG